MNSAVRVNRGLRGLRVHARGAGEDGAVVQAKLMANDGVKAQL